MAITYQKLFDPEQSHARRSTVTAKHGLGDQTDPDIYVFTDRIVLAVNVALATGRPILVRGATGSGKSTLAPAVATRLGWSYASAVMTSRTSARDLLWQVDHLKRLQDAQLGRLSTDESRYVTPGPLFWAFAPEFARSLMERTSRSSQIPPGVVGNATGTVVLIDEIDKADPDVPNNLLEALGSLSFSIGELSLNIVASRAPLAFITTNEERDLPPAFLRRCIALHVEAPTREQLITIGKAHFPALPLALLTSVAKLAASRTRDDGTQPSAAEYLDTVRACQSLGINPDVESFDQLASMTLWKTIDDANEWT